MEAGIATTATRCALAASVVLTLAGCAGTAPGGRAMTIAEIWENPLAFGDQIVRVQGAAEFMIEQTLQACDPPRCDCNHSGGHLALLDEVGDSADWEHAIWVATTESGLQCEGDECELVCRPFDPRGADALELVGRLRVQKIDTGSYHLLLDDLDVPASRRQVDGRWEPIVAETFTITLRAP